MELMFLGVGSAFNVEQYQSNVLITAINGQRLLIDVGATAQRALAARNLSHRDLHAIYVSHLHADHIGGLEWLALSTYFDPGFVDQDGKKRKLKLYIRSTLVRRLWNSLKVGLAIEGVDGSLSTFFDVVRIGENSEFVFADTTYQPVQTVHYVNNREIVPSYGLFFTAPNGQKVFFSGDAALSPYMKKFYGMADLIFQDCETSRFASGVHAHYNELLLLPESFRAKMVLYHFNSGEKPDAKKQGFLDWAQQGVKFNLGVISQ